MKNYRIYMIRHGITQGNLDGRYIGTTDLPLCEEGEEAISSLKALDIYPRVQKVYSSPLKRCLQTADIIYPDRLLKRIDNISECDFGDYEGMPATLNEEPLYNLEKNLNKNNEIIDEDKEVQNKKKAQKNNDKKIPNKKLNLLADISKNIKARESKGYHTALVKSNINTLVKTMNYLAVHNLQTVDDFEKYYNSIEINYEFLQKDKIRLMSSAQDLTEMIKFIKNYKENKYTFVKLQYAKNKEEYVKDNKEKLVIFQSAKKYFEVKGLNPDELKTSDFFEELKIIKEDKKENSQQLKKAKEQYTEIDIVRKNIEMALNISFDKKEEMEIKDKADKSILGKLRENVEIVEQQKKENKEKEQKDIQEK